ncbi:MAG: alkane 1-monooxygenase [Bacteroidetes bacterium]|nr:alkane 1-monooxygenase [Bacteroidota bacterium]
MKDLKYLLAFTIPMSCWLALSVQGIFSYATVIYAFGIIPILELLFSSSDSPYSEDQKSSRAINIFFDVLLYLNVPLVFATLYGGFQTLISTELALYERIGLVLSVGIVLGTNGINVAHELGHRITQSEQFLAKLLLLPSLYMHFFVEHNLGHHKHVGTTEDPATARKNQSVYGFWLSSVTGQIVSATKIQRHLLQVNQAGFFSLKNELLWFALLQLGYLGASFLFYGAEGLLYALAFAAVSVLLLETINYIEHYGLVRELRGERYERVTPAHSWNSNHVIGRMVLYELTRHSDHHHRASKKYQVLESIEESPQLPFGYTTSMVIALFPPLWFSLMNKRLLPQHT